MPPSHVLLCDDVVYDWYCTLQFCLYSTLLETRLVPRIAVVSRKNENEEWVEGRKKGEQSTVPVMCIYIFKPFPSKYTPLIQRSGGWPMMTMHDEMGGVGFWCPLLFKEAFFVWRFDSSLIRTWYARLTEWNINMPGPAALLQQEIK